MHYADGEARIALFEPRAWKARYAADAPCDTPECREQAGTPAPALPGAAAPDRGGAGRARRSGQLRALHVSRGAKRWIDVRRHSREGGVFWAAEWRHHLMDVGSALRHPDGGSRNSSTTDPAPVIPA